MMLVTKIMRFSKVKITPAIQYDVAAGNVKYYCMCQLVITVIIFHIWQYDVYWS